MVRTRRSWIFVITFMFSLPVAVTILGDGSGTPWLPALGLSTGMAVLVGVGLGARTPS